MNTDYKNGSRPRHDKEYEFFFTELDAILGYNQTEKSQEQEFQDEKPQNVTQKPKQN